MSGAGALASIGRKGDCCDDAAMESFWATLKSELIGDRVFETREAARLAIFDYIETFCNSRRLHSALGYKSPVDFETENHQNQLTPGCPRK